MLFLGMFWSVYLLWALFVSFACWLDGGCPDFFVALGGFYDLMDGITISLVLIISHTIVNWIEKEDGSTATDTQD